MVKVSRILKDYQDAGAVHSLISLWGFVDAHTFLTKAGALGQVFRLRGADAECLDHVERRAITHRLENALRQLDESVRVYEYAIVFDGSRTRVMTLPVDGARLRSSTVSDFRLYFEPWRRLLPNGTSSIADEFLRSPATTRHLGDPEDLAPSTWREGMLAVDARWLLGCVRADRIGGTPFGSAVLKADVLADFAAAIRATGVVGRISRVRLGMVLGRTFPGLRRTRRRPTPDAKRQPVYEFPTIETARAQFRERFGVTP